MRSAEVRAHLDALALTATDAARLLGVGLRSVRRWTQPGSELPSQGAGAGVAAAAPWPGPQAAVDPEGAGAADAMRETDGPDDTNTSVARSAELIPGPAAQALRAWLKLHRLGAHWRPDGVALVDVDPLAALERVRARGGLRSASHSASHWDVDLRRGCASMGGHRVSFVWPGRAPGSAPGSAPGTASSATAAAVPEVMGWALQSYCPERSGASAADTAGGRVSVQALAELVDDACASIARRLAGERAPPLPVLVLGEPAWVGDVGEAVELRDESFSPSVVCRLSAAALAAFLELPAGAASGAVAGIAPAQLLGFARRHHATLAELAGELLARPSRGTTSLGQRLLDIGAGDLGLVRAQLGWPAPGATAGAALGASAAAGRHETARTPATAVAVAAAGEGM
jgi:hypothetical protein